MGAGGGEGEDVLEGAFELGQGDEEPLVDCSIRHFVEKRTGARQDTPRVSVLVSLPNQAPQASAVGPTHYLTNTQLSLPPSPFPRFAGYMRWIMACNARPSALPHDLHCRTALKRSMDRVSRARPPDTRSEIG